MVLLDEKVVKKTDWYQWMNHKENTDLLDVGKFPNTINDQFLYLKNNLDSKIILGKEKISKKLQLGIVVKETNTLVGMVAAYNFVILPTCTVALITDLKKNQKIVIQVFKGHRICL